MYEEELFGVDKVNKNSYKIQQRKQYFKKIIPVILLVIILLIISIYYFVKYMEYKNIPSKKYYLENMIVHQDKNILEDFKQFIDRTNKKSFESNGELSILTNKLKNVIRSIGLYAEDFNYAYTNKVDNVNNMSELLFKVNHKNQEIFRIQNFENRDEILLYFDDIFIETLGIKKDKIKEVMTTLETSNKYNLAFNDIVNMKNQNIFDEVILIQENINKSIDRFLKELHESKFTVEQNISTLYGNKKVNADNFILNIEGVQLEQLYRYIHENLETSIALDKNRFKLVNNNKDKMYEILKLFKFKYQVNDKFGIKAYRIKNKLQKIEIEKEEFNTKNKSIVAEIEINEDKQNKQIKAIIEETKINFKITENANDINLEFESEMPKSKLASLLAKEANVETVNNVNQINQNINNDVKAEITDIQNDAKKNTMQSLVEKEILKINYQIPKNVYASNMNTNLEIACYMFQLKLKTNIKFVNEGNINIKFPEKIIYLDPTTKEKQTEIKNLYTGTIEPVFMKYIADKIIEIKKDNNINNNKEVQKEN